MIVRRTSEISGIYREIDLPITEEQIKRWEKGELAQKVFTNLSDEDREFIISGCIKEEWDDLFPEEYDAFDPEAPAF